MTDKPTNNVNSLDHWRLCDEFTVIQAALLIVGKDPALLQETIVTSKPNKRPLGYDAAMAGITHAIQSKRLPATIKNIVRTEWDSIVEANVEYESEDPDWSRTTVQLDELKAWLSNRGVQTGFFFQNISDEPDYLDPNHPRYAPKLAAAINAWLSLSDEAAIMGKSPKQALLKWLREHAAEFRLSDSDGNPNELGIEECAKVANWKKKGGAPKTPNK